MIKCPKCFGEIVKFPFKEEGKELREIWIHKPVLNPLDCDFNDGVVISLKVTEPLLSDRFQDLIHDAECSKVKKWRFWK